MTSKHLLSFVFSVLGTVTATGVIWTASSVSNLTTSTALINQRLDTKLNLTKEMVLDLKALKVTVTRQGGDIELLRQKVGYLANERMSATMSYLGDPET